MQWFDQSVCFINLVIGIRIFLFNFRIFARKIYLNVDLQAKIGILIVLMWSLLSVFFPFHHLFAEILLLLFGFLPKLAEKIFFLLLRKKNYSQAMEVLRLAHLKMGSGISFRAALLESSREIHCVFMENMIQHVTFSQQKDFVFPNDISEMLNGIRKIQNHEHRAREQLKNLVEKLHIQESFRHRSRQVLAGLKFQSYFMSVLFILALVFNLSETRNSNFNLIIALALSLYLCGLIWMFALGRRIKWKV